MNDDFPNYKTIIFKHRSMRLGFETLLTAQESCYEEIDLLHLHYLEIQQTELHIIFHSTGDPTISQTVAQWSASIRLRNVNTVVLCHKCSFQAWTANQFTGGSILSSRLVIRAIFKHSPYGDRLDLRDLTV